MKRNSITTLLIAGLLLWVGGCSKSPAQPDTSGENLNLSEEFGGYLAASEKEGFGDSELLGELADNEEFNDPILLTPEFDSVSLDLDAGKAGYYHLRAVWGQLHFNPGIQDITDWSGSLTVSRGVVIIRQAIHFELGQDYIVPRQHPDLLEWVSKTTVHNDGVAVDIFVPPPSPTIDTSYVWEVVPGGDSIEVMVVDSLYPETDTVTVTFTAGEYSRVFNLDELWKLDTVVELDNSNAIAFDAFRLDRRPCPRGFLAGRWGRDDEGRNRFRGGWMSQDGRMMGFVRGHYGVNDNGEKLFFGKVIGLDGEFDVFLRGTYGYAPDESTGDIADGNAGGWFAGHIFNADRMPIGILRGRFNASPEHHGGFFQGRWKLRCENPEPGFTDGDEGF